MSAEESMKINVLRGASMRDIGCSLRHLADLKNATSRAFSSNNLNGTDLTSATEQLLRIRALVCLLILISTFIHFHNRTYANNRLFLSSRIKPSLQAISSFSGNSEVALSYPDIWYVGILGPPMI